MQRVIPLWVQIDPNNIESRPRVIGTCAACAPEQVQKPRLPPKRYENVDRVLFLPAGRVLSSDTTLKLIFPSLTISHTLLYCLYIRLWLWKTG